MRDLATIRETERAVAARTTALGAPCDPPAHPCGAVATFYIGADKRTGARIGPATLDAVLRSHGIDGYTAAPGAGVWRGAAELSTVVTVAYPATGSPGDIRDLVARIGRDLARAHRQDSVGWTLAPAVVGFADPRDA